MSDNKIEPVAWRVECRWVDRSKGGDWRKYADYGTLKAAESSQQVFANPGDIESRIIPLVPESALAAARREALEEAWRAVVAVGAQGSTYDCAAAIRALKEKRDE